MKISTIGAGYVGLVSGTCLASSGHTVTCVDVRPEIVAKINGGKSPIFEASLQELLTATVRAGKLRATTDARVAIRESDLTLICVGTPRAAEGMDLSQIVSAARDIGQALVEKGSYHVVTVKSTVLPGTTEGVVKETIEKWSRRKLGEGWGLCVNPEFLREGRAVEDFLTPDRVVIGASDDRARDLLLEVYAYQSCPKVVTTPITAEMIKYVSNSLFATLISFSNEMANVCSGLLGVDAREVWKGVHLDRRLTPKGGPVAGLVEYLWHGLGFGGSCFPKDVFALQSLAGEMGESSRILDAVLNTNALQPYRLVKLLEQETELRGRKIAVLGLAFKPGTDDTRDSPALPIIGALLERGAKVTVHDPVATLQPNGSAATGGVELTRDWSEALRGADACCLVTAWQDYRSIGPDDFIQLMKWPLVIDGRGILDAERLEEAGVVYRSIGYGGNDKKSKGIARDTGLSAPPASIEKLNAKSS